jgi:hypothetical protein
MSRLAIPLAVSLAVALLSPESTHALSQTGSVASSAAKNRADLLLSAKDDVESKGSGGLPKKDQDVVWVKPVGKKAVGKGAAGKGVGAKGVAGKVSAAKKQKQNVA